MSSPKAPDLPSTHKALYLTSRDQPLEVKDLPTPTADPGTAVVRVLAASVLSYSGAVYSGRRPYPFPTPLVPGTSCIARIAALGPDSTSLSPTQLVLVDSTIRSRDNPSHIFLHGLSEGHSPGSKKLMAGVWRDGTFAQFAKVPLESVYPLDEAVLLGKPGDGGLGYSVEVLAAIFRFAVPYGGLRDIEVVAGETVIVAPATGPFGGAAVRVALAMGARVVAVGRNEGGLRRLVESAESGRVIAVPITSDPEVDARALERVGMADAYFDISPTRANESHHVAVCIRALRWGGRVSLMGGLDTIRDFPHRFVMRENVMLRGTWMCTRSQAVDLVKMVERGVLRLDGENVRVRRRFGLEEWREAFEVAERAESNELVVLAP